MAIYHLHAGIIQRSKGKHAIAASAYRRAAKLMDECVGKTWNYLNKPNVIHCEMMVPTHAPAWAQDLVKLHETDPSKAAEQLWNLVESSEKRVDSQLAREIEFALPLELEVEQNIVLARSFIQDQFVLRGMIADWVVHWDKGNPHVHVLLTMRRLTDTGFGARALEWNHKALLLTWRGQWAAYVNFHLRLHQQLVQIDHRSYVDQGIDLIPGIHEGKAAQSMVERGLDRERIEDANTIRRLNLERIGQDPIVLFNKLSTQQETFTFEEIGQELGRYVNGRNKSSAGAKTAARRLKRRTIAKILKEISHHESVFGEKEMAKAVVPFTDQADALARAVVQIKASKALIPLGIDAKGVERFTTQKLWRIENRLQTIADKLRHAFHIKFSEAYIDRLMDSYQQEAGKLLTTEQLQAVHHLVAPLSLRCVVGRAGTGKSFLLGAAKHIWESKGLKVYGIALSGIAADGLNQEAGIDSTTIESFRAQVNRGSLALKPFDVIVMDEAGMSDSVSMLAVLKIVKSARAKLVLLGDPAQLQPVGPGASFRALIERCGFAEIQMVYRQSQSWQQEATMDFSAGHIGKGLVAYQTHQAIHIKKTADEAMEALVKDWLSQSSSKDLSQCLVMAHRNQDVAALNTKIREARVGKGEIKAGSRVKTSRGEIAIAKGDRLLFLKNNRQLGLSNGRFATIKNIEVNLWGRVKRLSVILDHDPRTIKIDLSEYADFALGYAATVHKSQGITVDHTWIYAGGYGWNRHLTYVALSRHRQSCHLYADETTYQNFKALQRQLGRSGTKDSVLDFPLAFAERRGFGLENYLDRLQKQLTQSLAHLKSRLVESWHQSKVVSPAATAEPSLKASSKHAVRLQADEFPENNLSEENSVVSSAEKLAPKKAIKSPHYDVKQIQSDLNAQAETVVQHYLGDPPKRQGNTWRYGSHQGSLVVTIEGDKKGLWHDFQTNAGGDMLGLIRHVTGQSDFKAILLEAMDFLGGHATYISNPSIASLTQTIPHLNTTKLTQTAEQTATKKVPDQKISLEASTQQKIQKAQAIVKGAQPIQNTLAEQYLREHRGIQIPLLDKTFRYHPHLRHWMTGNHYPALLIMARDQQDEVCGLQAIFLDPKTGKKVNMPHQSAKLSRGVIKGGAIVQAGTTQGKFAIAEGPETALSIAQAHPDWTVYTSFGISNFAQVALSLPTKALVIALDHDGEYSETQKSVECAAQTLSAQGKSIWLAKPQKPVYDAKWDFNDVLPQKGIEAIKQDFNQAILYQSPGIQKATPSAFDRNHPVEIRNDRAAVEKLKINTQALKAPVAQQKDSTEQITVESLLMNYVKMELAQIRLVELKQTAYAMDPENVREAVQKTIAQANHIQAFAQTAAQHPEIQAALEASKNIKPLHIADRGGFVGIFERLKKGEWCKEDIHLLLHRIHHKATELSLSQTRTQDRDRGGRKR